MPVFHTKTIESILEPVAQQVSKLVILHEEAEGGKALPDLYSPIHVVKQAVDNLVKVGYETVNSSEDQILKQDMSPALHRVEESSILLLQASDMLRVDSFSCPAHKMLIEGSRGILQGTSALLLAFDESEVRKIIRACKNVLEYLAFTEMVDKMEDLVTYVKNLSPVLTRMTKEVDVRQKDLTHQVHRDMLIGSLEQIKNYTPVLISGVKIFITAKQSNQGVQDAQTNRDYMVCKMSDEIHEVIRVLQLTTYDEEGWDADDITIMKKAQSTIEQKITLANDWLSDPSALVGSSGNKSLHQILEDAQQIANSCSNPDDHDHILKSVSNLDSMSKDLSELRQQGKGNNPQAISLAREMQQQLNELQGLTGSCVTNTERSGIRKPAPTVEGKVEQAQRWLLNPAVDDRGLGEHATRMVVIDGRHVAESYSGPLRSDLLHLCDETEILTNQLCDAIAKEQGDLPQTKAVARHLSEKLHTLKSNIQEALVYQVAEDFIDITTPMKQLTEAAFVPLGTPAKEANFNDKTQNFVAHAKKLIDTATMVATAAGCRNKKTVEQLFKSAHQVNDLTPQVTIAARIVFSNPGNQAAVEHFELLKRQWNDDMERLRGLVDEATETTALIKAEEEGIVRDTDRVEDGISKADAPKIITNASSIARRANRVLQVAQQELENSEDLTFLETVNRASEQLRSTIPPMVQSAKVVSMAPHDKIAANNWIKTNQELIDAVGEVRKAVMVQPDYHHAEEIYPSIPEITELQISEDLPLSPLPSDSLALWLPCPDTEDEDDTNFPVPQENQPIMMAAHALHMETKQWSSKDNEIIAAAKRMTFLMVNLSQLVRGEGGTTKDLISTARSIAEASEEVTELAKKLAAECTDKKMRTNLLQVCERIPTIGTQLKILSTVKATMCGAQGSEEDQDATEMLVCNAQNLMQAVKETVRAAEAASIKIRVESGYMICWLRKRPWYT